MNSPAFLVSCGAGRTSGSIKASLAEKLANELDSPVVAPIRTVWDGESPHIVSDTNDNLPRGRWRVFLPGDPSFASRSKKTDEAIQEWNQYRKAGREIKWDDASGHWVPLDQLD